MRCGPGHPQASEPGHPCRGQSYDKLLIVPVSLVALGLEVSLRMLGERSPDEPRPGPSEVF